MRKVLFGVLILAAVAVSTVAAQQPALSPKALAGKWEGQRGSEDRVNVLVLTLRAAGDSVAGTISYNGEEFGAIEAVGIKGNVLTFAVNDLTCRGVVTDDSMLMTVSTAERELWSVTLKHQLK